MKYSYVIPDKQTLQFFSATFVKFCVLPLHVYLSGDLGAGKTTFVQEILRGFAVTETVKSPTFTFVETYYLPSGTCYHYDLYRCVDAEELTYLGLNENLQEPNALIFIEWPERGKDWLPDPDLAIQINLSPTSSNEEKRIFCVEAKTTLGRKFLEEIKCNYTQTE